MGCSTFANFTVLPEIALAKVREDAPFDKICYIGCGVTTGVGAVINTVARRRQNSIESFIRLSDVIKHRAANHAF